MRKNIPSKLLSVLKLTVCVLILKVTISVVRNYRDYFPPNFESDFLFGRDGYFAGSYQWAFYSHIAAGPGTLLMGMILLSDRFRKRSPQLHRILGRVQVTVVLAGIVPSGLWMAAYAETGIVAGAGFATLAIVTGLCVERGWRSAVRRQFVAHRRWMMRCYVLLCSAVVLRLMAGVFTVTQVGGDWSYPFAAWASWLVPLAILETMPGGCFGRKRSSQLVTTSASR